ncbi:MAG: CDP-alcohol phosphatidyltransferase family protein [Dokdonella sp.]|uniref:CDP-alcohol phosphatidyltransferase family protein n=1 Tax=Dokdonella sp. TaxID=2291710 RepID=UPI0025BF934C|nr:CDP-alcohol phosphatidyltransferase family protein [Dokdonella sp.]MBX3699722.1 CDP-alcohol phosphatidyltransferase family protein [Dokdonella sp.]MCW5578638.1 CDP-alcohol phosphatidyltransferase family protein [Dokdonella sp.]
MPSIYQLKPMFQRLLRPLVRGLARAGISANQVTLAAVVLAAAVGASVMVEPDRRVLWLLPAALFVRMALNAIDGMLAREHGQMSRLGAILNELGDVVADAAMYLPLALRPEFAPIALVLLVVLGILVEMTGVIGVQIGASRRYDGPLGKSDRAFLFGALGLLLGSGVPSGAWLAWLLWLAVGLSVLTVVNRARGALTELRQRGSAA